MPIMETEKDGHRIRFAHPTGKVFPGDNLISMGQIPRRERRGRLL